MKRWFLFLTLACLLAAAMPFAAQEKAEAGKPPEMTPEMQAMMEAYAKAATPGPEHEFLGKFAGLWVAEIKYWMGGSPEPTVAFGVSKNKMILGGRYLYQEFVSSAEGKPFEGIGITGFDNVMKKVNGVWLDTMGTSVMTSVGTVDLDEGTMHTASTYSDPLTGKAKTSRDEMVFEGEDTAVFKMFDKGPDGKEFLQMQITYRRIPMEKCCPH